MISVATWILWVHLLGAAVWLGGAATALVAILPAEGQARALAMRRAHFLTSRAMEVVVLTGLLNLLAKGLASSFAMSRGFFAMLAIKMVLLVGMAGLQIWMGLAWKRAEGGDPVWRSRVGLFAQCLLGAGAALLGLGLRVV